MRVKSTTWLVAFATIMSSDLWADAPVSESVLEGLRSSGPQDVIVKFDATPARLELAGSRLSGQSWSKSEIIEFKRDRYGVVKQDALSGVGGATITRDFALLPLAVVRVQDEAALNSLRAKPRIKGVFEKVSIKTTLMESLPLVRQPAPTLAGVDGR